jgi:hypothetical protein
MSGDASPALLVSTFTVAALHGLLPSHWLCFVLVGRARGWSLRKTLSVTAAAGAAHVASTLVLGVAAIVLARQIWEPETLERVSAVVLLAMGSLYIVLHFARLGHRHEREAAIGERVAVGGLFVVLIFSPCEAVIPLFLAAAGGSAVFLAAMAVILTVATIGVMTLLVWLARAGAAHLDLRFADRHEKLIIGGVLAVLGAIVGTL